MTPGRSAAMLEALLRRTHLSQAEDVPAVVADEARAIGASGAALYVVDYEQKSLVPVPGPATAGLEPLSVNGTVAGRCFANTSILTVTAEPGPGRRVWLPLLDGTERIGVLEMSFPDEDVPGHVIASCERYAHLIAMIIVSKSAYSDFFERLRRRRPMTAASELLWALTPPKLYATKDVVVAALLEPCYDNGGDCFDYALNDGVLHHAVFDAMGHGLRAAGLAAFALSTYRQSRVHGADLAETYSVMDSGVAAQYRSNRFVTGLMAQLDISSGNLRWISAGHPAPLLLRDGRLVKMLEAKPVPPIGLQLAPSAPQVCEEALEPGDMVVLYTDGLTEARRPDGDLFTDERLAEFIEREAGAGHTAPEVLRRLREAIIERRAGDLRDDATAVLIEWRRGSELQLVPKTV